MSTTDDGLYPITGLATTALKVNTAVSLPLEFTADANECQFRVLSGLEVDFGEWLLRQFGIRLAKFL